MSNIDSSIPLQEFDLKYASEDNLTDSDNEVFELDSNFDQYTVRFSNVLSEMLAHENNDIEMETYIGEYDSDIEAELEQDNNEQNFDNEQEERDEIIPNDDKTNNVLSPCVIIDNIHGTIKRCGDTYKLRKMRNLFGTWQIDRDAVQQVNNDHLKLGVCDSHFLYDQNQIHNPKEKIFKEFTDAIVQHRRCIGCKKFVTFFSRGEGCSSHSWLINGQNIQVPCNGVIHCNALRNSFISRPAFNKIKKPRFICCACYEQLGGHVHKRTGRGKKSNCIQDKLHEKDTTKGIKIIANWLIKISHIDEETKKEEILKSIVKAILPFIPTPSTKNISSAITTSTSTTTTTTTTTTTSSTLNHPDETPSLFIIQILFLNTSISNEDTETIDDERFGREFEIKLWKSRKAINEKKDSLNSPESLLEYYNAFPDFVTEFFQGLLVEIFKRKLVVSNKKRKYRGQNTKTLPENTIIKIVTFFVSVLVGIAFPSCGIWLTNVLSSLARKPKLLSSLHRLLTVWNVIGHSERHERNLERERINKVIPTQRLYKELNIWNLAIIDNIDFKQKTFSFGNIYDTTRDTSHATLRMVFQSKIPDHLVSCQEEVIALDEATHIFGMNFTTKEALNRFQNILEKLLDIRKTNERNIEYNRNFDAEIIKNEILAEFEYGCQGPSPHVVILEPADNPNSDQAILEAANMYKADFNLQEDGYLDIVADEAIFRRLMRCQAQWPQLRPLLGQWHTSKDFCSVLIVLFSSYGLLNLAR